MTHSTEDASHECQRRVGLGRWFHMLAVWLMFGSLAPAWASPQFARQYRVDCSFCHVALPRLNQQGENFLARGYQLDPAARIALQRTMPLAVWNTFDLEHRDAADVTKAFPGRVEIVSGGRLGQSRASYFIELRALSQQIASGDRLLNRSGRLEDAFVAVPLDRGNSLMLTVGQFRTLNQLDVSRRLSLSEPLALSASVPDPKSARTARLTNLRAFAPAGRQPAVRLMYQDQDLGRANAADGWYASVTVPLAGEMTLPLTDAASFEFEARPKGLFAETYYRTGLTSFGGHAFVGDDRGLGHIIVTSDVTPRWSFLGALGFDRATGVSAARYSIGGEYVFSRCVIGGTRVDHRTGQQRDPAVLVYVNSHLPLGPSVFRQALRLQFEQTLQHDNLRAALAVSHIF
jgi:hypothetical protein